MAEHTLFQAGTKSGLVLPGQLLGGDEDEASRHLGERIGEAVRAARRRKALSFLVVVLGASLTVLFVLFAPRSYAVEARVLVQQRAGLDRDPSPEAARALARELEEQMTSHDALVALVREQHLVARWGEMRPAHARVIDKFGRVLGRPAPTEAAKQDALVALLGERLHVTAAGSLIDVRLAWTEPRSARDIVDTVLSDLLRTRRAIEVDRLSERVRIHERFEKTAKEEVGRAGVELAKVAPSDGAGRQNAQVELDVASAKYQSAAKDLQELLVARQNAEATFKDRYTIVHPPEIPAGPSGSIGFIAALLGTLGTIAAVLVAAALADRSEDIFYEPRDARDRLGLRVFATFA